VRPSLLINCSRREAQEVRAKAGFQRRTVSAYVINIVIRAVQVSERLASSLGVLPQFTLGRGKGARAVRPRTTLHIYCTTDEAKRIRNAAQSRKMTISGFVLGCLRRSWEVESSLQSATIPSKTRLAKSNQLVGINRELTRGSGKPPAQTPVR
jgi:hypothetical protein